MTYLPDTNAWIGFLNADGSKIQQRLKEADSSNIRLCSGKRSDSCNTQHSGIFQSRIAEN